MKTKTMITLVALALAAILAVGCIFLFAVKFIKDNTEPINLNEYVVITEEGRDGYGSISVSIDYDRLLNFHPNLLSKDVENAGQVAKEILENDSPYLVGYILTSNLKNGDEIEFTWKTDAEAIEKLAKVFNAKIECSAFTYTMKDLGPVIEVDLFADVRYERWGTNGNGSISPFPEARVTIAETGNVLSFPLDIVIENDGNLSNGDIVHMKLSENVNLNALLKDYGIVFVRTEADIVLDGFAE
jgi:hypothetical protein